MPIFHPFTLFFAIPLYLSHFLLFSTLAIYYKKTGLSALYFFGVIYGLYEGFITKVIWKGYDVPNSDPRFGPDGCFDFFSFSMAVYYHPIFSWMQPLAIVVIMSADVRRKFRDLG